MGNICLKEMLTSGGNYGESSVPERVLNKFVLKYSGTHIDIKIKVSMGMCGTGL
jgi:hypothetical protein